MSKSFEEMLAVGGKSNSLGEVADVIKMVLHDKSRMDELYECLFNEDAWLRMRAADALEKVCRQHPEWLMPYVDKLHDDFATGAQPSIQWHMAQIYRQVDLTKDQKRVAIAWLKGLLSTKEVDWIVAANAMDTLAQFTKDGSLPIAELLPLLKAQQEHRSDSVVKRANKLLAELTNS